MRNDKVLLIVGIVTLLLSSCQSTVVGTQLIFREVDVGTDPAISRILFSDDYLRIDDGVATSGYVLFNRRKSTIYNVNPVDRTVMVIASLHSDLAPPVVLHHTDKALGPLSNAPKINNTTPLHYQYLTNNELCMDVISVAGMLPEMQSMLVEYLNVLATDSATTFVNMPADLQKPCEMSISTFAPARQYQHGFPIREWRPSGYQRALEDVKEQMTLSAALFRVPDDYFVFSVQQLRDGQVDLSKRVIVKE